MNVTQVRYSKFYRTCKDFVYRRFESYVSTFEFYFYFMFTVNVFNKYDFSYTICFIHYKIIHLKPYVPIPFCTGFPFVNISFNYHPSHSLSVQKPSLDVTPRPSIHPFHSFAGPVGEWPLLTHHGRLLSLTGFSSRFQNDNRDVTRRGVRGVTLERVAQCA